MCNKSLAELQELLEYLQSDSQTWEEHQEAVTEAEQADIEDQSSSKIQTTLVAKTGIIISRTLNDILNKELYIENGAELLSVVQAVALFERLKEYTKDV